MRLEGKVAIITGGGRGIGRAIALAFAREGARVVIAARSIDELNQVAQEIQQFGGKAFAYPCDVSEKQSVDEFINQVVETFGRIDIIVNNAGVCITGPFQNITESDWDQTIDTNLKGIYLTCQAVWELMACQGGGSIVNISSGAGKRGRKEWTAYCASKFGVIGFSEALALEGRAFNIRVNSVCPGGTDTSMQASLSPGSSHKDLVRPEDVAQAVVFLVSDEARAVSGASLDVRFGRVQESS